MVAQGSVVDPEHAEELLAAGYAAVELTRAQIADAGFVAAVRAGRAPRPCLLCNQACLVLDTRNPPVSCVVDPRSGHETTEPEVDVPARPGCPGRRGRCRAGRLEAARVLALHGHDVEVVAPAVGGLLPVVAAAPGRDRFHLFAGWLAAECTRLGVRFTEGTTEDADVVATGGLPAVPVVPGAVPAAEVLAGAVLPAGPVLVHDPVGGPVGIGVAELLAAGGREVVLATPDDVVGARLGPTGDLVGANRRLARAGVRRLTAVRLVAWDGAEAVLAPVVAADLGPVDQPAPTRVRCAAVVDAGHRLPGRTLPDTGRARFAGDVVAPRTVLDAVLEGRRAALAVAP